MSKLQKQYNDVMVDLETLSTRPNGVILTIGAIKFDRNFCKYRNDKNYKFKLKNADTFYRRIEIKSCEDIGLVTDVATKEWWDKQSESARTEAFGLENRVHIQDALVSFSQWLGVNPYIWAHGACFDPVLLDEAYKASNLKTPWKYFNVRDTRTLYELGGITNVQLGGGATHHALEDCVRQINGVNLAMQNIFKVC